MEIFKALCYANSGRSLSYAYANRSTVYYELKLYDECMLNINWAKEYDYPEERMDKMNNREEVCLERMKNVVKDPADDPMSFFKLSYSPNPKIPFITDRLAMRASEKYGRGIYATKDLKAGDIIVIEEAPIKLMRKSSRTPFFFCTNCTKCCMHNLIPCTKTGKLLLI